VGPRRAAIQSVIDGLKADGGTNISEGLRLAYAQAHQHERGDALEVVFLMSDGRPNGGMTGREPLARLALDAFQDGIQTSAFGLGADYDGALMSQIAGEGAGGYYYVASPAHIAAALTTELEKRLDPVALGVEVRVRLRPDVQLLSVYGSRRLGEEEAAKVRAQEVGVDVQAAKKQAIARDREEDTEGGMRFFMPAFGRDDAHAIMLKLKLPPGVATRDVALVELKYKDLLQRKNRVEERPLKVTFADGDAASAATIDRGMQRAVQRFAAGQALASAATRVQSGDTSSALTLLDERMGILRHAAIALGEPTLGADADRLSRLRSFIDPSGRSAGDPLALALLVDAAGQSRLR
jgi:Ca-activated chloride channel family protein